MESKTYPKRKNIRLKEYDYSQAGAYFVTICTAGRKRILSAIPEQTTCSDDVGAPFGRPCSPILTEIGECVKRAIENLPKIYSTIQIDDYVIMPNHVHAVITIYGLPKAAPTRAQNEPPLSPTLGRIINQLKGSISKQVGESIWQKSFYEHIIRNACDYDEKMKYLYENPLRWHYDELYTEN